MNKWVDTISYCIAGGIYLPTYEAIFKLFGSRLRYMYIEKEDFVIICFVIPVHSAFSYKFSLFLQLTMYHTILII